eukprot:1157097-Pelagomonas_calceolata.AAC.9
MAAHMLRFLKHMTGARSEQPWYGWSINETARGQVECPSFALPHIIVYTSEPFALVMTCLTSLQLYTTVLGNRGDMHTFVTALALALALVSHRPQGSEEVTTTAAAILGRRSPPPGLLQYTKADCLTLLKWHTAVCRHHKDMCVLARRITGGEGSVTAKDEFVQGRVYLEP